MALVTEVLNTDNDRPLREHFTKLFGELANLANERNVATHTMWVTVMPSREVKPHPALPRPDKLKDDFKAQFTELTAKLRELFHELWRHHAALRVHLEQRKHDGG